MKIATIVEGDGEVVALPVLLKRLSQWLTPGAKVSVETPIRVRRDRFLNRSDEFERYLKLAAAKCGKFGWVLILLDADDACPATMSNIVAQRAREAIGHKEVAVVFANREYEAWFIAAASSLHGCRGFSAMTQDAMVEAEVIRDAKGWIKQHMLGSYKTLDQKEFSQRIDLQAAHANSRSFRKLCAEWQRRVTLPQSTSP